MSKPLSSVVTARGFAWPKILLVVLLALLVLLAAIPSLLSTAPGRGLLLGQVNERLPGTVTLERLSLSWFGSQTAAGLRIEDPDGSEVLQLESFSTELSIWAALRGRLGLGETRLSGLLIDVVEDEAGGNNLYRALGLGTPTDEPGGPLLIPVTGHVIIEDARLSWTVPGWEPILVEGLMAELRLDPSSRDLDLNLAGRSRQGDMVGRLQIEARLRDWLDDRGALTLATADPELDVQLDNLPLRLLDGLSGADGLLVAALGDRLALDLRSREQQVEAVLQAPRLQLELAASLRDETLALSRPAALRWELTPDFLARFGAEAEDPLRLQQAVDLRLALERLDAPLTGFDPSRVALRGRFDSSAPLRLRGAGLGDLRIDDLRAEVLSDRLAEAVTVTAGFSLHNEGRSGRFALDLALRDLFDGAGRLQTDRLDIQADASVADLPTALLDRLAATDGLLAAALGPRLDLDAQARSGDGNRIDATLDLRTEQLRAEGIRLRVDDVIALENPARIRYRLTPAVLTRVAPDATTRLRSPADLELVLATFEAPRPAPGEAVLRPDQTLFQGRFSSDRLEFEDADGQRSSVSDLRIEWDGDSLAAMRLRGRAGVRQPEPGILAVLGASPLQLQLELDGGLGEDGTLLASSGRIEASGGGLQARLPFQLSAGLEAFSLTSSAVLDLPLTPAYMASVLTAGEEPSAIRLADTAPLRITLDRLDMGLTDPGLHRIRAEGKAELGRMRFLDGNRPLAAIDALTATLQLQGERGEGRIALDGRVSAEGSEPGTIAGRIDLSELAADSAGRMAVDLEVTKLPAGLLAAFSDQPALPEVLGSAVDARLRSHLTLGETPQGTASLNARARHLSAEAELDIADAISLKQPAQLRWTLTPAAHAALSPATEQPDPGRLLVAENTVLDATVTRLRLPRGEAGQGRLPDLEARLSVADAPLRHSVSAERYRLQNLRAEVATTSSGQELTARLTGAVAEGRNDPGAIDLELRVGRMFDAEQAFSTERLALDVNGRVQQLPVAVLDRFLASDQLLVASLGRSVDARIDMALREGAGPVDFQLRGGNARADLAARWDRGTLTLRETLTAEVQPTEEFGRTVLARLHPVFETMRGGKDPIRLTIPAQGVVIPTGEGALGLMAIPELRLQLGRIELERGWLLDGLVTLGQRFGNLRPMGEVWTVEFTPAVMQLAEGQLAYSRRLDLLLGDQMHFATWGRMNLVEQRADLLLGIMPLTLRSVFGVAANENDALRIPIQGAPGAGMINFSQIGVELARLQAQRRLGAANPLFGALLGAAAGGTPGLSGAPQPSVSPLPWAERLAEKARRAEEEARKQQESQQ